MPGFGERCQRMGCVSFEPDMRCDPGKPTSGLKGRSRSVLSLAQEERQAGPALEVQEAASAQSIPAVGKSKPGDRRQRMACKLFLPADDDGDGELQPARGGPL